MRHAKRNASPVDVAGTGFTVLDRIYADGDFAAEALGGSCGNVLLSLAMLSRQVAPILALGMDETGERLFGEFVHAGAETCYISRRDDILSPVLAQQLDTATGRHWFSFTCPETNSEFPRYQPIRDDDVTSASAMLSTCAVFYTDRLSETILLAMETAHASGAIIYFEPSEIENEDLLDQALEMVTVFKYSADRLGCQSGRDRPVGLAITIVTYGSDGLEIIHNRSRIWCEAVSTSFVADTTGSGDMVSIGLIDWLLTHRSDAQLELTVGDLVHGVVAGQHLAAANCAYAGARGLFQHKGAAYIRKILAEGTRVL